MKVYKLEMDDMKTGLISDDLDYIIEEIRQDEDGWEQFKITSFEMSKEDYEKLPEFEGF